MTETSDFVTLHSRFEADRPDEAHYARAVENHRRAVHIRAHGSEDGYQPRREFPCKGVLRVYDKTEAHLLIHCDACGYETSCRTDINNTADPAAF